MPTARKFVSPILLGLAVPALLLAGFFHAYPIELFAAAEQTVILDPDQNPVTPRAGQSYYCDLTNLSLAGRADNAGSSPDLHLRFYENGEPLTHEIDHSRIETQPGLYSHWDHYIAFSPRGGKPDSVYSIRYLALDESRQILAFLTDPRLWTWTAAMSLLALAMMAIGNPTLLPARLSLLLLLALAGSIVPHLLKGWNVAETMADSQFYVKNSARPPLYPWFIAVARGDAAWSDDDFRLQRAPFPHPSLAILRVVRAQRLVLWSCFLIAAWAVSFVVPRPLAVLFFFLLHRTGYLLPNLERCVMSEPLALAMLYLVVAVFSVIVARRSLWPLPLLATAFGALVLTRSAGAFAVIIFAAGVILVATTNWRRKRALAGILVLTCVVGFGAFAALLGNSHTHNGVWTLSPLKNWERVAFALEIADSADIDAMPDADSRQFLSVALKDCLSQPGIHNEFDLNKNCWEIAYPTAHRMFVERFGTADLPEPGEFSTPLFRYVNGLFGRVADTLLTRHRDRYWRIVAHSFLTRATRDCTRLNWRLVSFWWMLALGFLACLVGWNRCALAGATCLAAHLGNLIVMSCFELPLDRYVYFSEWICLLGLLLASVGCGKRWIPQIVGTREESNNAIRLAA